jgi:hypothetical protein
VGSLAGSFPPESKGLPRGRGRIDPEQVGASQRARLLRAAISAFAELGFAATIRATVREYLRVCAEEPEFTRTWTLEFPGAGPDALQRRHDYFDTLAGILSAAHTRYGHPARQPNGPQVDTLYVALIGGCHELFYRHVSSERTLDDLPELEEPIVGFLLSGMH